MPRRDDISSIMIIGAGPIIIGQACEFDYSGAQACKALREEGYRIILVNSNPATIMTDPGMADATYIEPITPETVAHIIEKEKPDALLPTMGGQTALNTALALARDGVLERLGVELIGASISAIEKLRTENFSARPWIRSALKVRARGSSTHMKMRWRHLNMSAYRRSSARHSPWAVKAAALLITVLNLKTSFAAGCGCHLSAKC